jgi:uncharacterized membrane protein
MATRTDSSAQTSQQLNGLTRFIPILSWLPRYDRSWLSLDVIAGLTLWGLAKEKVVKLRDAAVITRTDKGKIKLHQTRDDSTSKGLLKGGVIGVIFALLFGPAGWIVAGSAPGGAFATFDRGIKNKLLKELGEKMTPEQSALAVLVEEADWEKALGRMADLNLQGEVIVQELVAEHLATIEKLVDVPTTEAVPEELKVEAPPAKAPAADQPEKSS